MRRSVKVVAVVPKSVPPPAAVVHPRLARPAPHAVSNNNQFFFLKNPNFGFGLAGAAETSVGDVGPVNIGNPGCEFTMNQLVDVFRKALRRPADGDGGGGAFAVKYLPRTQDDPMCRRPVITKAQELFGFRCDVGLEEGIQRVWDYFL